MLKLNLILLLSILVTPAFAERVKPVEVDEKLLAPEEGVDTKKTLENVYSYYNQGKYEDAILLLNTLNINIELHKKFKKDIEGLAHYWRGICYLRMNEFNLGIKNLEAAIIKKYTPSDIWYEYGQALYTSFELKKARVAFKKSILKRYKMAVSMYYIASISQEIGDMKTAASFYNGIEKLPKKEKKDVVQAARMQLGDIYLEQIKRSGASTTSIEEYVLPQYKKALEWDEDSALAIEIKNKIETIERRYDLVLFQLRNGRPTARPPYFLKANLKYTTDNNVNAVGQDERDSLSTDEVAGNSTNVGFYGRYAFYPNSSFSIIPQISFNYTDYLSDEPEITQNNGYVATATLQTTYEHIYNRAPATLYLDLNYSFDADDTDQDDEVEEAETVRGFTLSEQIQLWVGNPSIFRLRYNSADSVFETYDRSTTSAVWEQIIPIGNSVIYGYTSYDMTRYPDLEEYDTNGYTVRVDALLPDFRGWFNTNLYTSYSSSNYLNDSDRGTLATTTYGVNINRPFGKNYFMYLDYALSNQDAALESDQYDRQVISLNLDYIF